VTDPYGGTPAASPSTAGPPRPSSRRPSRWASVGPPVVLACLVAVVVAVHLAGDRGSATTLPGTGRSTGSAVPSSALEGEWSGEGSLTFCAGFDDEGCPATRSVSLTIDCREQPCVVTPFDRSYGRPPLTFEYGSYRAAGPVPADVAPTCGGAPTSSALWRLELAVRDGRLAGRYAESTLQGFDCGATGVEWRIAVERR
jgi:hypothetical protein